MYSIKVIEQNHNKALAQVIKAVLIQQGNNVDGTVFTDAATDNMYEGYQTNNSIYYVVLLENKVVGGCGIAQLSGEKSDICELQRLFLLDKARGLGIGKELMKLCIAFAKQLNYELIYLETFPNMIEAIGLYQKTGFTLIQNAMGNTGHFYCTTRMTLKL